MSVEIRGVKNDNTVKRREITRAKLEIDALKQKVCYVLYYTHNKKTFIDKMTSTLFLRIRFKSRSIKIFNFNFLRKYNITSKSIRILSNY